MKKKLLLGSVCLFLFWITGLVVAQDMPVATLDPLKAAEQQNARRQTLEKDKAAIERLRQEQNDQSADLQRRLGALQVGQLTEAIVQQARLDAESVRLRQEDLQSDIASTERRIKGLGQAIRELEAKEQLLKNPAQGTAAGIDRGEQLKLIQQSLLQQRVDLELENQALENLRSRAGLNIQIQPLAEQWRSQLEELYRQQQEQSRQEAQVDLVQRLQREQQGYIDQATQLRLRLQQQGDHLAEAPRLLLETSIKNAEDRAKLIKLDIRLSTVGNDLARWTELADKTDAKSEELQTAIKQLRAVQSEGQTATGVLQRNIALYEQQKQVLAQGESVSESDSRLIAEQTRIIANLADSFRQREQRVQNLLVQADGILTRLQTNYKASVSKDLLARRLLPGSAEEGWQLLDGIASVPKVLFYQVRLSLESTVKVMLDSSYLVWLGLVVAELALVWLIIAARRGLKRASARVKASEDRSFSSNFLLTTLRLLRKNLLGVGSALAPLLAVWIFQIPQPGLGIIMTLVLLWVCIKTPINLAWLFLASPQLPPEQQHPQLYRQLVWVLLSGGILAAISILVHLSALPEAVIDVFDRLLMCQWLLSSVPLLRLRRLLIDRLATRFASRYWFISLRFISLLLPLSLLGAAILGLVGYMNLAWAVAWYLVVFIAVLMGWQVVRGLFDDLVVVLKNYAVTHSSYGLLWTQEIINPLQRVIGVVLFLGAGWVLFKLYGMDRESALVSDIWAFLERSLFTLGGAEISLWRIAVTVVTVLVVFWFGGWCRAVTFRWVFSRIVDLGVRNSLSVFTQYFVVLSGLFIVLRILGLDLTTLTIFAGAVGVGIGLGMQTIANNFVSGLLLLIERPLRSGDTVKIGANEGEISRIGIRSLTVKTFDNLEVIIPNSEVINNAFTNWTHNDKVVRTVLMIGASYDADPHQVKVILERVLNKNKTVLREPTPLVLLWEFGHSSVDFRIQYFIDMGKDSLLKTRADILLAVWDAFKQEGVGIPYPQRDLYIKEIPAVFAKQQEEPVVSLAKAAGGPTPG